MPRILSVNVGRPRLQRVPKGRPTGIDKHPADVISVANPGPRRVVDGHGVSGVAADHVGDGRFHGGWDRAVYAYAREELDLWADVLGRELREGHFGENLTTSGIDVDAAEVGDRWHIGTAVLEVRWTRQPCATFGEWMGEPGWVKRFMEHGRTGALLSVVEPGDIRTGNRIEVEPSGSGITLPMVLRAKTGDVGLARRVIDAGVYTGHRRQQIVDVLERDH
ncbi:MOSC domain-containing protein [Janibacter cremeus]|uniref:MOSC domain-containing protein YiiM n=1 Tax=Janibacter cremeus TaxID=1285192 RepID=A0A852W082_9MICO|nr:MOSC domain-containing protein [Janibacter cremeus]NYF99091.1 MOSC domain-containing protein YiiM [Janibacter cremeus]